MCTVERVGLSMWLQYCLARMVSEMKSSEDGMRRPGLDGGGEIISGERTIMAQQAVMSPYCSGKR